jgi:WD40 repeat protein
MKGSASEKRWHEAEGYLSFDGRQFVTSMFARFPDNWTPARACCLIMFLLGLATSSLVAAEEPPGEIRQLRGVIACFSPDGHEILTGGMDGVLRLWDANSGAEVRQLGEPGDPLLCIAFCPTSRDAAHSHYVLAGRGSLRIQDDKSEPGPDQVVQLLDTDTGKEKRSFRGHTHLVTGVAFSPDGRRILSGSMDGSIRLWKLENGQEMRRFEGHAGAVRSVSFSPDGRCVLSGGYDGTARVWDVESGKELKKLQGHQSWVTCAVFSPDGRRALTASADKSLRLWDVESGREIRQFLGHSEYVWTVAISADGRRALSGSGSSANKDNTVRLWDVDSGKELYCFEGHEGRVATVAFSPDGLTGLSAAVDDTVRLWRLPK